MTTATWSSGNIHGSDANFRTWGKELSDQLALMTTLVKTADTGQINWTTVLRPAINTDGGYEVYYLNDSMHATAPIYIKIYYGTGTVATNVRIRFEIGTATNGAGVISGQGIGSVQTFTTDATGGSATAANSYLCVTSGFFGLMWKMTTTPGLLIIQRTCNGDGTINNKGAFVMWRQLTVYAYAAIRYEATAGVTAIVSNGFAGFVPHGVTSSLLQGGDKQIFLHWGMFPDMRPMWATGVYVATEFTLASTFSCALVGASARTFITGYTSAYANANSASYGLAMLWE